MLNVLIGDHDLKHKHMNQHTIVTIKCFMLQNLPLYNIDHYIHICI